MLQVVGNVCRLKCPTSTTRAHSLLVTDLARVRTRLAPGRCLGKLAERIALVLMGKHKPIYDPSVGCGDYVIVTNSRSVKVTERKQEQLLFRKHSMFPAGLKETSYKAMKKKNPGEVRGFVLENHIDGSALPLQLLVDLMAP